MVMEIPETVISTREVNEDELQSFNKVREEHYEICRVFPNFSRKCISSGNNP